MIFRIIVKKILGVINVVRFSPKCKISLSSSVLGDMKFEGHNVINSKNIIRSCHFGVYSYIGDNNILSKTKIGRFCSLGSCIKTVCSTHPIDSFVSSHPSFYKKKYNILKKDITFDETLKVDDSFNVVIGNDVWIGDNVIIKGGVVIGDGAIVGFGSVVTKNVEPYSIVAGNPAKIIKFRYSPNVISKLLKIKWWNMSKEEIANNSALFSDIDKFLEVNSYENC